MAPVGQTVSPSSHFTPAEVVGGIELNGISSLVGERAGYLVVNMPFLIP
jgi:hypothetical protein